MSHWSAHRSQQDWNTSGDEAHGFRRWARAWKRRRLNDTQGAMPRGGTAGPAAKDPPAVERTGAEPSAAAKSMREQYGISAMIYGLIVLVGGIYCAMTDVGRVASERAFALDAAAWAPKLAPARRPPASSAVETYSTAPLSPRTTPVRRLETGLGSKPGAARSIDREPTSYLPKRHLEPIHGPRYVTLRNGA